MPDYIDRAIGEGARDLPNFCGWVVRTIVSFSDGDWKAIWDKHGEVTWRKVKVKLLNRGTLDL